MADELPRSRILVIGLGGIGGIISAHLIEQGQDVVAVTTNPGILEAIKTGGYWLASDGESRIVPGPAYAQAPKGPPFDYIFLATQPPQVEAAAKEAVALLAERGAMVVFQNGLCEERIAAIAGSDRVIGAIISFGASMVGPGRYERSSSGGFTVGVLGREPDARCRDLGLLLECIGPVEETKNLAGARWSKLALNAAISTLGAVGGERLGGLLTHRFIRRLAIEVMTETVEVARKEGIRLEKVTGTLDLEWMALTSEERRQTGSASLLTKHALILAVGARYRRLRSSMLAAIERGRPPAVDFLNGEVVSRGERHGIKTPVNKSLQQAVHQIARGEQRSQIDLLRRIYEHTRDPVR